VWAAVRSSEVNRRSVYDLNTSCLHHGQIITVADLNSSQPDADLAYIFLPEIQQYKVTWPFLYSEKEDALQMRQASVLVVSQCLTLVLRHNTAVLS